MDNKLYSPEEVLQMFPAGRRTSLRKLIATAKEAGCCIKLGRGIGLTQGHINALWEYLSKCSGSRNTPSRPIGKFAGLLPGSSYIEVRKLLTERKRKNSGKHSKERHSEM